MSDIGVYLYQKLRKAQKVRKNMKFMKLKINCKNGNTLEEKINYLHYENGKLHYTVDVQIQSTVTVPVTIPLENIESFDLTKSEVIE